MLNTDCVCLNCQRPAWTFEFSSGSRLCSVGPPQPTTTGVSCQQCGDDVVDVLLLLLAGPWGAAAAAQHHWQLQAWRAYSTHGCVGCRQGECMPCTRGQVQGTDIKAVTSLTEGVGMPVVVAISMGCSTDSAIHASCCQPRRLKPCSAGSSKAASPLKTRLASLKVQIMCT